MATRSLGTLTLDLIAKIGGFEQGMDKAGKASQKWRRQVSEDAKVVGTAIGAGIAAAAAGLTALTVQTVRNAEEIQRLASVSNTGSQDFQRYAAAAKAVGVEQDKLADIFKDTSDKVGDFLQTGGGALADFFENIAPQVGVTAEQFRNLSGPEALGLYVSSLEKANVSQNEMTFYLEAIASDATLLLPLLRDNGKAFGELGDQAERAGAILDQETIRAANELNAAMLIAGQATEGLKNQLSAQLLPVLSEFAVELAEVSTEGTAAVSVGQALASALRVAAAAATGAVAAFQLAGRSMAAIAAGLEATDIDIADFLFPPNAARKIVQNFDQIQTALDAGFSDVQQTALDYGETLNKIWSAGLDNGGGTQVNSRVKELADLLEESRKRQEDLRRAQSATAQDREKQQAAEKAAADAANEAAQAQQKILDDYQSLVRELRTDEEALTDQVRERLAVLEAVSGLTDEQRNQTLGRIADAATVDAPEFSGGDTTEAQAELEDWYATQLDLLKDFRKERADLNATWNEEELAVKQEYEERLNEITTANEEVRRQQMLDGYSAILGVVGSFYDGMEGEEAAYARAAIAIGQTLLDEKKRNALQSIIASTQSAAMGAYESLASIPYIGPFLGAAAAGGIYIAGGLAAAEVSGLAHDGIDSIPEDGTWLLEKGERVTTAETSAKLDRTLANIEQGMGGNNRSMGGGGNTYNYNVAGDLNRETAAQAARESERKQRMTARRIG